MRLGSIPNLPKENLERIFWFDGTTEVHIFWLGGSSRRRSCGTLVFLCFFGNQASHGETSGAF
jgi:hypothetical protein